jgi:hypothetical protein
LPENDMTAPNTAPSMHRHTVALLNPASMTTYTRDVMAAYFVEDQSLVLFKNSAHQVVAAFKSDLFVSAHREDSASDNGS